MREVLKPRQILLSDPFRVVFDRVICDPSPIYRQEVVNIVFFGHVVCHDLQPFLRRKHLHLRLLPIRLARLKFSLSVRLNLIDAGLVLAVKIDAQTQFFNAYLPVHLFDPDRGKDLMLVCGSCFSVAVPAEAVGASEFYKPPLAESVRIPVPHYGGGIRSAEPTFSRLIVYHNLFNSVSSLAIPAG